MTEDAAAHGRVDEDGTVYVRTVTGERAVGSYPGAAPDEALAYFARKFVELEGQVDLLEQRLGAGGLAAKDAATSVAHLRAAVTDAHAVGDLDALLRRLDALEGTVAARREQEEVARTRAKQEAVATKERIVSEAETLAGSTEWKRAGDQLRALLDEWKAAPRLDRRTDDGLWKRFSHARTAFDKARRAHFAELDVARSEAAARKEELVEEAESLAGSREWGPTAAAFRDLMTRWKKAGRARRDVDDALWTRFRAAQDSFFGARNEVFAARDADLQQNLTTKEALLVEAEAILPVGDPREARSRLRALHERWDSVGHVPRAARDRVEGRLRRVDEAVRSAEEADWSRSSPETRARAEATVAQLRSSIAGLEEEAQQARAAGDQVAADRAEEAAGARRTWLDEAERTLAELS